MLDPGRPALTALLAGLLGGAAACGRLRVEPPARPTSHAAAVAEGRRFYLQACAACHGMDGRGDGPVAPTLIEPPADLTRLAAHHGGTFPRDLITDTVTGERRIPAHGTRVMPVWSLRFVPSTGATAAAALYARRRLDLLLDYLESLQIHG